MSDVIDAKKLKTLNDKVYERGMIDREHLLEFLTLVTTSDSAQIILEVKKWLTGLHEDPHYSKVSFPNGDIDAIIGDLDSYGRVQAETVLRFKEKANRTVPMS